MPTLTAASKQANIEKSIVAYVSTNVETGLGLTVYYQRSQRFGPMPDQWLELDMMPLSPRIAVSRTAAGSRGVIMDYLININVFEKNDARTQGNATIFSLSSIVDQAVNWFMPVAAISIRDYDTVGNPIVGALESHDIPAIAAVPTPANAGITQVNISATMRYMAEWQG